MFNVPLGPQGRLPEQEFSMINYHLYMVAAFLAVVITYFGVNYLLGGMHSYA